MIIHGPRPVRRHVAPKYGHQTPALHIIRDFYTGHIKDRWGIVYIHHKSIAGAARFYQPRITDQPGNAKGFLIHEPFVEPSVFSEKKTMVTGNCLLYTSDAADDLLCVDLGGRR